MKDSARVSEIELQPGGMIPSHHHNGPHLVVAIHRLSTCAATSRPRPDTIAQMKSGEVVGSGGYTHTLTNVNKQPAKFVTIEFP